MANLWPVNPLTDRRHAQLPYLSRRTGRRALGVNDDLAKRPTITQYALDVVVNPRVRCGTAPPVRGQAAHLDVLL